MKGLIRAKMLEKRKNLSSVQVDANSCAVFENLKKVDKFLNAESVFCYVDFKNEIKTDKIMDFCQGKPLFVPLLYGEKMYAVKPVGQKTTKNKFGVDEPDKFEVFDKSPSVTIVPIVACDKSGNRIGFGKGYYDKYLQGRETFKIGICHSFQVIEKIDSSPLDVKLDLIVTEEGIYWC